LDLRWCQWGVQRGVSLLLLSAASNV
jgi:hypothetical protein